MVSGMFHNMVEKYPNNAREHNVHCTLHLTKIKRPLVLLVIPANFRMSVMHEYEKPKHPIPDQ